MFYRELATEPWDIHIPLSFGAKKTHTTAILH